MEVNKPKTLASFIVNSKGHCFFCLRETSLTPPEKVKVQPTPTHSLQYLSRFLRMDTGQVLIERGLIPPRFRRKVEGSQLKVSLCQGCASLNGRLKGLCRQLEKIEMEVMSFFLGIQRKLAGAGEVSELAEVFQNWKGDMTGGNGGSRSSRRRDEWDLKLVETLRAETMRKCSHKLSLSQEKPPRVKLRKLTMDQVNKKCQKFRPNVKASSVPLPSTPSGLSSISPTPNSSHPVLQQLLRSSCNPLHSASPSGTNLVHLSNEDLATPGSQPVDGKRHGPLTSSNEDYILPEPNPDPDSDHIEISPVKAERHPHPVPQFMEVYDDGDSPSSSPSPEKLTPAEMHYDDDSITSSHSSSPTRHIVPTGSTPKKDPVDMGLPVNKRGRRKYSRTLTFIKDRRLRKKAQNRWAAAGYRQRKKNELAMLLDEESALQTVHDQLEIEKGKLESEIRGVRSLLTDVIQTAKCRRRAIPHKINRSIVTSKISNQN